MKLGVVMSGKSMSSKSYWSVELVMTPRQSAEILDELSGAERKVAASTSRLPQSSNKKELEHRKSAPSKGHATSVMTKSHGYVFEVKWKESVHFPYFLIELPL